MLLQIKVKLKMCGRSVTFGPKSVEKHFQQQNFFELMTPFQGNKKEGKILHLNEHLGDLGEIFSINLHRTYDLC